MFDNTRDAGMFWDFARFNYRLPQRRQVALNLEAALAWVENGIVPRNHGNILW